MTGELPVLYSFRRCPYAMRARMALAAASIRCELREVLLRDKPRAMLAISSKGTVPVLQTQAGEVIDESLDLMHWALQQSDPDDWLAADQILCQKLITMNDYAFKIWLDRYKYSDRFPEKPQQFYREKAEEFLSILEHHLSEHAGKGLLGEKLSIADIAIFPFIRQFSIVDRKWFNHSNYHFLINWLHDLENSPLFLSVMEKYQPWKPGEGTVIFP